MRIRFSLYLVIIPLIWTQIAATAKAASSPVDEASPLFDAKEIQTMHLRVSAADWSTVQQAAMPEQPRPRGGPDAGPGGGPSPTPANPEYVHADLEYQGKTYKDIGLRCKGHSSLRSAAGSLKLPLKLAFNKFIEGQAFLGLTHLHLNIDAMDPSRMREYLTYSMFRQADVPCSRTAYAKVYLTVPGKLEREYLGVYTLAEDVGKPFLKDRFGSSKGLLLKPERTRDLPYLGDQWTTYADQYGVKTEGNVATQQRLIEFVKLVHQASDAEFAAKIGQLMEVDEFVRFLAVNVVSANMDSYLGSGHNYYLYVHPKTLKVWWIPWDLNEAFAGFGPAGSPDVQMDLSIDRPCMGANRLVERVLSMKEYREAYRAYLKRMVEGDFSVAKMNGQIAGVEKVIASAVAEEKTLGRVGGFGQDKVRQKPEPRLFVSRRVESILSQPEGKKEGQVLRQQGPGGGRPDGPGGPGGGFHLIPRFAEEQMNLSEEQRQRIAELEREGKARFDKILTPAQKNILDEARPPRPGQGGQRGQDRQGGQGDGRGPDDTRRPPQ